jgi:hypothetical protein
MTRFDLSESNDFTWPHAVQWFRLGLGSASVVVLAWVAYGAYKQVAGPGPNSLQIVGAGLIFWILGSILLVALLLRAPAAALVVDESGVRLEFRRGAPYVRLWNDPHVRFKGRRTVGVGDSISRGRPRWSVYGRFAGLTETFVPEAAFTELVNAAATHGFHETETQGNPGWLLYTISR